MDALGDWGDDDSEDDDSDDSDDDSSSSRERAPRVDDDDDGRRPVPGTLFLETPYVKYAADVAAANRDNVKPSGKFRRMHAEEEDLHRAALRTAPEDLVYAKDWRLPLPCRPSQLVGMCYVHTSLAHYYEEGMRLPPGTGRVDHVNDRFWKDRDLVCEVFRREYGFDVDAELPDDLLAKFHSLWRVDLMGNDVEYSLEALVVRPLTFHYRWRPRPTVPSPRTRTRAVAAPRAAARRPGAPTAASAGGKSRAASATTRRSCGTTGPSASSTLRRRPGAPPESTHRASSAAS